MQPDRLETTDQTTEQTPALIQRVPAAGTVLTPATQRVQTESRQSTQALQHPLASKIKKRAKAKRIGTAATLFSYKKAVPVFFSSLSQER